MILFQFERLKIDLKAFKDEFNIGNGNNLDDLKVYYCKKILISSYFYNFLFDFCVH